MTGWTPSRPKASSSGRAARAVGQPEPRGVDEPRSPGTGARDAHLGRRDHRDLRAAGRSPLSFDEPLTRARFRATIGTITRRAIPHRFEEAFDWTRRPRPRRSRSRRRARTPSPNSPPDARSTPRQGRPARKAGRRPGEDDARFAATCRDGLPSVAEARTGPQYPAARSGAPRHRTLIAWPKNSPTGDARHGTAGEARPRRGCISRFPGSARRPASTPVSLSGAGRLSGRPRRRESLALLRSGCVQAAEAGGSRRWLDHRQATARRRFGFRGECAGRPNLAGELTEPGGGGGSEPVVDPCSTPFAVHPSRLAKNLQVVRDGRLGDVAARREVARADDPFCAQLAKDRQPGRVGGCLEEPDVGIGLSFHRAAVY